jgi:hypothetical protein
MKQTECDKPPFGSPVYLPSRIAPGMKGKGSNSPGDRSHLEQTMNNSKAAKTRHPHDIGGTTGYQVMG